MKLVINADDFGLSDGICRSILGLLACDAISNTTIMSAADGAIDRVIKFGPAHLLGRAGVHLQISSGRPLSPAREVPTLVDRSSGEFRPRHELHLVDADEVEVEWRRQIEVVSSVLGELPTHLDSHHGAHRLPQCVPVYLRLAREFGLAVRGGTEPNQIPARAMGIEGSDLSLNTWTGRSLGAESFKQVVLEGLESVGEFGVLELVAHPGFNDAYLGSVSSLSAARENDHAVLMAIADSGWLAREEIKLVRYPLLN